MRLANSALPVAYVAVLAALVLAIGAATPASGALTPGAGSFVWTDNTGDSDPDKSLQVYYWRPTQVTADTPVWIIMHGNGRTANTYRNYFVNAAAAQGAIVLAPKFSDADWPGSVGYALGNISTSETFGSAIPEQEWSFSKIEPLFDYLKNTLEPTVQAGTYSMFGHSAGGQFVHRFLFWKPTARVDVAVAANAGWYTMAQYAQTGYFYLYPYTLTFAPQTIASGQLNAMFDRRLTVLLGDQDTNTSDPDLRTTAAANAQGPHRFARGQFYYNEGKDEAADRSTTFSWDMKFVRGVAHSGSGMAVPAAELFRFARTGPPPARAAFGFDDASGTGLAQAVDSASGLHWAANVAGVATDGAGRLDVNYASGTVANASLELPSHMRVDGQQIGFARMVVQFDPWTLTGSTLNEQVLFGFGNTSATDITAQVNLRRVASDQVALQALGASSSSLISVFQAVESDPIRITIDLDVIGNTYQVLYQVGDEPEYVFYSGSVTSNRIGRFLRLSFNQYFNDPGENFRIASYEVQYTRLTPIPGDANDDERVDETDAAALAAHWGQSGGRSDGDFNGDGVVNAADAAILAANWNVGVTEQSSPASPVPEPGAAALAILLATVVLRCRSRYS